MAEWPQLARPTRHNFCYASAATVAAVRNEAAAGRIAADETVLDNLTGRSRVAEEFCAASFLP